MRRSLTLLLLVACLTACGARIASPFIVRLTLDEAATTELQTSGEQVQLIAYYYWRPNSGGPSHEDNEFGYVLGGYPIGEEVHEVPSAGEVRFSGNTQPSMRVRSGEGEANVLINVVSARRVNSISLLECSIYEGSLAAASRQGIDIHCSLPERHRRP